MENTNADMEPPSQGDEIPFAEYLPTEECEEGCGQKDKLFGDLVYHNN